MTGAASQTFTKTVDLHKDRFWLEDPCVLLKTFCIFPSRDKTRTENLNCITTLAVIVAIVLILFKFPINYVLLGLFVVIVLLIAMNQQGKKEGLDMEELDTTGEYKEGFSKTDRFVDDDFIQTNVTPLFAEEWQFTPPAYELIT